MWNCSKCGTQNSGNSNYCSNCGSAKLQTDNTHNSNLILILVAVALVVVVIAFAVNSRSSTDTTVRTSTAYSASKPVQKPSAPAASSVSSSHPPSSKDLDNIGADIEYPQNGDYLGRYETMYVSASAKGGTVYALHGLNDGGSWKSLAREITDGTKVTVIARHSYTDSTGYNTYACCIFSVNGNQRAGWISMGHLTD